MQRKTLIPVIAVQAVALVGLAWFAVAQATTSEPAEQGVVLDTAVTTVTTTSAVEISGTTTVVLAPTDAPVQQAPAVQEPVQQQGVGAATEPEPTGPEPTEPTTTTTRFTMPQPTTTTYTPSMPWCYNPAQQVWYSGVGEGCTPDSPHFVEYR